MAVFWPTAFKGPTYFLVTERSFLLSTRTSSSPLVNLFVVAISSSYAFMDWINYKRTFAVHPDGWMLYFSGQVEAPGQYRIGIWDAVLWMHRWLHLKPYDALTLIDVFCVAGSLWVGLRLLRSLDFYQSAPSSVRWLANVGAFSLAEYYIVWGYWYQTGATMPSVLFVVLSMALVYGAILRDRMLARCLLICLGIIQAFIRADVAVILHAGIFLAYFFGTKRAAFPDRRPQAVTSLLIALLAGGVQLYLMFVRFPNARYGAGGVVRVTENLHPEMLLTMLLGLFPYWVLVGLILSKRYKPDGPTVALLASSALYLVVWFVVGRLEEVRIFLPFAFALVPATVAALIGLLPLTQDAPR